jgi:hypothetical protein
VVELEQVARLAVGEDVDPLREERVDVAVAFEEAPRLVAGRARRLGASADRRGDGSEVEPGPAVRAVPGRPISGGRGRSRAGEEAQLNSPFT